MRASVVRCTVGLAAIATSLAIPLHGAWMLAPAGGTALVIAAGDQTWLARRVLANPVATYLGRISYPLYLWHWPILAFLRILDDGPPSPVRAVLAVAASVVLAAITHRCLEQPIQRGPTLRIHVLGLVAALLLIGSAGFWVFAHDGVPTRAIEDGAPSFIGNGYTTSEGCLEAHPYARLGCYESPRIHAEMVVVLGDSHGDAVAAGLVHAPIRTDLRIVTRAGCMPFRGVEYVDPAGERVFHCREVFDPAIDEILADRRVTTVVLVARHAIRVNLTGFGAVEPTGDIGHFELADGTRDPAEVFRRGLAGTIAMLQARGIRVVFVDQVPELGFEPRSCVARPFGSAHRSAANCSVPRAEVVARQRPYRAIVDEVLARAPGVVRIDPLPLFCDAERCSPWRDGELLYHDDNHLGRRGAGVLGPEIAKHL